MVIIDKIKKFFAKRELNKRIEITRKQFNQIKYRDISMKHKTKLSYVYLRKIHKLQRELAEI